MAVSCFNLPNISSSDKTFADIWNIPTEESFTNNKQENTKDNMDPVSKNFEQFHYQQPASSGWAVMQNQKREIPFTSNDFNNYLPESNGNSSSNSNQSTFYDNSTGWKSWNNVYNWIDIPPTDVRSRSNCSEEQSDSLRSDSIAASPLQGNSPLTTGWAKNEFTNVQNNDIQLDNYFQELYKSCEASKTADSGNCQTMFDTMLNLTIDENMSSRIWSNTQPKSGNTICSNNMKQANYYDKNLNDFMASQKYPMPGNDPVSRDQIWRNNNQSGGFVSNNETNGSLHQAKNDKINIEEVAQFFMQADEKAKERNKASQQYTSPPRVWNSWEQDFNGMNIQLANDIHLYSRPVPQNSIPMRGPTNVTNSGNYNMMANNMNNMYYQQSQNREQSPNNYMAKNGGQTGNRTPFSRQIPVHQQSYSSSPNYTRVIVEEEELKRYSKQLEMQQTTYGHVYNMMHAGQQNIQPNMNVDFYKQKNSNMTTKNGNVYNNIASPSSNPMPNAQNMCKREHFTVNCKIDDCAEQYLALEKERKKTEAQLATHNLGKKISSTNNIQIPRLPPAPSRIDRLIVDFFREHARVITLLSKMSQLRGKIMPTVVTEIMTDFLDSIKHLQQCRFQERQNILKHLRGDIGKYNEEVETFNLLNALSAVIKATQRARSANWCCLMWTLGNLNDEQQAQLDLLVATNFQLDPPEMKFYNTKRI